MEVIKKYTLTLLVIFCLHFALRQGGAIAANLNKPFDLRVKQLTLLNSSPVAKAIRKEFDEYVETRNKYPEYPDHVPNIMNAKEYLSILSKKIIILEGEAGHFGGYNLTVAIDPENTRYFWIWIYNIGDEVKEEWNVRSIEEIFFDLERLAQLKEIKSEKYAVLWH